MSAIYQAIMQYCYEKYNLLKTKETCSQQFSCEPSCLSDIYWTHKERTYDCQTITNMYVLRFMNKYASEIYYLFLKYISNLSSNDLILSIGSGPCFETVGIERFCREKNISNVKYIGSDLNNIWQNVANICCGNSISQHLFAVPANLLSDEYYEKILPQTKVLILNYVLSDYKNHKNSLTNYLNNSLSKYLDFMPKNSYVIINDVNHSGEWEDEFDSWKDNLSSGYRSTNFFFNQSKACNPRGERIEISPLIFDNSILSFASFFNDGIRECTSSGTIIYKEMSL